MSLLTDTYVHGMRYYADHREHGTTVLETVLERGEVYVRITRGKRVWKVVPELLNGRWVLTGRYQQGMSEWMWSTAVDMLRRYYLRNL